LSFIKNSPDYDLERGAFYSPFRLPTPSDHRVLPFSRSKFKKNTGNSPREIGLEHIRRLLFRWKVPTPFPWSFCSFPPQTDLTDPTQSHRCFLSSPMIGFVFYRVSLRFVFFASSPVLVFSQVTPSRLSGQYCFRTLASSFSPVALRPVERHAVRFSPFFIGRENR